MDLEQHEQKYTSELNTALQQCHHLEGQAQDVDSVELQKAQLSLRPEKENSTVQKLREAYAGQYDPAIMSEAKQDISEFLNEEIEKNIVLKLNRKPTVICVAEKEKLERQPESYR